MAALSIGICKLERADLMASGKRLEAKIASKIRARASMVAASGAPLAMPKSFDLSACGVGLSAVNGAESCDSDGGWGKAGGLEFVAGKWPIFSSSSRRESKRSNMAWLSRLAAAFPIVFCAVPGKLGPSRFCCKTAAALAAVLAGGLFAVSGVETRLAWAASTW